MKRIIIIVLFVCFCFTCFGTPVIYITQVGFDAKNPKIAIIGVDNKLAEKTIFNLVNTSTGKTNFTGTLDKSQNFEDWISPLS